MGNSSFGITKYGIRFDSDYPLEKYMKREGLDLKMPEHESEMRSGVRQMAKNVMRSKEETVLNQGLGVVLSGTGSKLSDIVNNSNKLKKLGYETCMIYVNADLETALHRNAKRERSVPEEIVREKWNDSQKNLGRYQQSFDNFFIIDNSETSNVEIQISNVFKKIRTWCKS